MRSEKHRIVEGQNAAWANVSKKNRYIIIKRFRLKSNTYIHIYAYTICKLYMHMNTYIWVYVQFVV